MPFGVIFGIIFWITFWSPFGPLLDPILGSILAPDRPKKGARCAQEGHQELQRPKKLHFQKHLPAELVKDLRTNHETSDTGGVLDGNIDAFLSAALAHAVGAQEETADS